MGENINACTNVTKNIHFTIHPIHNYFIKFAKITVEITMKTLRPIGRYIRPALLSASAFIALQGISTIAFSASAATPRNAGKVYVDNHGRMRMSADKSEARYFGVNYTTPFAHAYRALGNLGVDRHTAIDRDVYHMSRLGLNAFRLHLWDVELTDSVGNLLDNDHLELLDYLIGSLEKRGIDIILTAQTNFGNGYPERNEDTGGFSYLYGKCEMHSNPEAIKAQQRYIGALARHVNPHTGKSYADDPCIIAMEINNEPCHESTEAQVTGYIDTMASTLRNSGWRKPILYNVSHNIPLAQGYFNARIDGTTYQWYPIGLVSDRRRRGNFLPFVDRYHIPYTGLNGYADKAKVVYEFDPADMLDSYLYPAVARTFAREGFQWATQFAYDPIDMAAYNTEYQTHFLNLAYTPQKALGMKIARKVMEQTPAGADTSSFPADTVFGNAAVSYRRDLATWNTPREYFHTNSTDTPPADAANLMEIAGYGNSPLVKYPGLGAYFIDRIAPGVWRVEVMPDALYTADPFAKPSLSRRAAVTIEAVHPMTLLLPGLSGDFRYQSVAGLNHVAGYASQATFPAKPGVYLVANDSAAIAAIDPEATFGNSRTAINEYVAPPAPDTLPLHVNHTPEPVHRLGSDLHITAQAFGPQMPDSLIVYPDDISFWREHNRTYTMHLVSPYRYEAVVPAAHLNGKRQFRYRITAVAPGAMRTFPSDIPGSPLDWDSPGGTYYTSRLLSDTAPVTLLDAADGTESLDISTIPDHWGRSKVEKMQKTPFSADALLITLKPGTDTLNTVLTKYVKDIIKPAFSGLQSADTLCIRTGNATSAIPITVSLVNSDGVTYGCTTDFLPDSVIKVPLNSLVIKPTLLCPAPYPSFLMRKIAPENYDKPLDISDIERFQLSFPGSEAEVEILGAWLE